MKKLCAVLSLAGIMAASNSLASLTATLAEVGGNQDGGGLFQATLKNNNTGPVVDVFDTFCVSIVTTFSPGDVYNVDFSSTIVANVPPTVPTYITYGTAYIYNQFLGGNANYGGGPINGTTLDKVQATIWYLQGLLSDNSGYNLGAVGSYYDPENLGGGSLQSQIAGVNGILTKLEADTGKTLMQLEANGNGAFGVVAMNLTDGTHQPQLAQIPEATTVLAGTLLLLPFGASTLRILRRKNRS